VTALRAALFNALALLITAVLALLYLPLMLAPPLWMQAAARVWIRLLFWLLAHIVGLSHRVVGESNLPTGPFIVAAKHQSAWETFAFNVLLSYPVFVIKRELFRVPFYGWFAKHAGMIGIDRKGGASSLRQMVTEARAALAANRPIVIFPEGTRTAPGATPRYQSGIAALYQALGVPVVPCALNSGLTWGRRAFLKKPGLITIEYLPPIPPGLPRDDFMARLKDAIETASAKLQY
jgi:1-acyl-sn-glycerol-3-phosphate acyltransferase